MSADDFADFEAGYNGAKFGTQPAPTYSDDFSAEDFAFGDTRAILMTAKDAVKCAAFADARFWEVPAAVRLGPDGGVGLVESIVGVLQTPLASRPSRTG